MTTMPKHLTAHIRRANGRGKNVCASAVLAYFHIAPSAYRQCQYLRDILRILRNHAWSARSRMSQLPRNATVTQARKWIRTRSGARQHVDDFAVVVKGHVLLLNHDGDTVVDTDPRKVDRRRVTAIYRICPAECA